MELTCGAPSPPASPVFMSLHLTEPLPAVRVPYQDHTSCTPCQVALREHLSHLTYHTSHLTHHSHGRAVLTLLQERAVMGGAPLCPTLLTHSPLHTSHTLTTYTMHTCNEGRVGCGPSNRLTPSPAPVNAVVAESLSSTAMTTPPCPSNLC